MSKVGKESVAKSTAGASSVLMGRFDHALDPKRRLTIPSEWRRAMGNAEYVFVIPDHRQRCLNLLPPDLMEARLDDLRRRALFDPKLNDALQTIGANSEQLILDVQGRVRICDRLLQFAGLTSMVAMVGSVRMIKLWNPDSLAPADAVDQDALGKAIAVAGF